MKKIYILLFIIVFAAQASFAQNAPISTIGTVSGCPGSTVNVPITVTGFTGIGTMDLYINYNPAMVTYNSFTANSGLNFFVSIGDVPSSTLKRVLISFATTNFNIGSTLANGSTLITLHFSLIAGSSVIGFNNTEFDCEWTKADLDYLNDQPTSTYYINGAVNASPLPGTGSISGLSSVAPGTNGLTYSTTSIPNATSYNWSVPSGFTITAGNGTSSITVNATLSATSGNVTVKGVNTCGDGPIASYPVSTGKQLSITVFPEGLFNGSGLNKTQGASGDQYTGTIADKVTVKLHSSADFNNVVYTLTNVNLSTSGTITESLSSSYNGSYYLSVTHRNSIQVVSSSPVSFASSTISYNFSTSASQAYGNNQKQVGSSWVMFTGDVNQDGCVDGLDFISVDNKAASSPAGYQIEDLNGNGTVNITDINLLQSNATNFVKLLHP
jgi:hypothetical protein